MHFYIGYWPIVPRGPPLLRGPDKGLLNDPRKRPAPLLYSSAGLDPNADRAAQEPSKPLWSSPTSGARPMANKLSQDKKRTVISALVEGNSIRSIERMTGVHRDTICRLLVRVGDGCEAMMRERFTGLDLEDVQVDEIWTYVAKKQRTVIRSAERVNPEQGDQWVFVALDAGTKLVPCWLVGKRSGANAYRIVRELADRIDGPFQLTTDAFAGYKSALNTVVRRGIDYATQIKSYTATNPSFGRYSPPRVSRCTAEVVCVFRPMVITHYGAT